MACPGDAVLARFVDGELGDEAAAIEVHIDECASCRQTVSAAARRGTAARDAAPVAGDHVGRYRLVAPLGAGAMGVVYAAIDPELDRRIAVKLLAPGADADPRRLADREARLAREARALARISHPNVVPVFDVGTHGARLFIAMELVDGQTLREHIARRAPPARERVELIAQAAAGLAAAHAAGVVHRDFKPDNVLVGADGRVRVGDFGLAAADAADDPGDADDAGAVAVTRSGALVGTPAYMAPEQLRGEPATAASDQFALCVTAWEALFGERPFRGATPHVLLMDMASRRPAPPAGADAALVAALRRGLAANPAERHPDVAALGRALARTTRPRTARLAIGAGIAAIALAGAALAWTVAVGTPAASAPCDAADDELLAVWPAAARSRLTAAFERASPRLGADTATSVGRALDARIAAWSATARRYCTDHRAHRMSDELYDRRVACVTDRRTELAALVALFERADAALVERAARAVEALAPADACERPGAIATLSETDRAAVAAARASFATGHALRIAGRYAEARDAIAPLAAAPLPDPALLCDMEIDLGIAELGVGKLAAARDHLSRALAHADRAGDDVRRSRAFIEQLAVVGDAAVELDEAARLGEQATAAVARAGNPASLRALLHHSLGNVELRRGRFPEAATHFEQAIALERQRVPVQAVQLANSLNSGAGAYIRSGDHARALAMLGEARALVEGALGSQHPSVGATWASMVEPLVETGRRGDAFAAAQTAIAIFERGLGPDNPKLAQAIDNLAILHAMNAQPEAAIPLFERGRGILERALGPEHVDVGTSWFNVAGAYKQANRIADAVAAYDRAIAIWTKALGDDHVDVGRAKVARARALAAAKRAGPR